jgi:hypothetical protein
MSGPPALCPKQEVTDMLKQIDDDLWVDEEGHEFHAHDAEVMAQAKPKKKAKPKKPVARRK